MRSLIDWFWDGVLLKEISDKTAYKMYVGLYAFVFIGFCLLTAVTAPFFLIYFQKNIFDLGMLFGYAAMVAALVIISGVLFVVIRDFKKATHE